ncbi:protein required for normal CLN1 and CLN2 G1 cyclin expression [Thecaphora frezii]
MPYKRSLDLPVATNESITVDLDPLPSHDDLQVFIEALIEERPPSHYWTRLASQCWIEQRHQEAELICQKGVQVLSRSKPIETIPLYSLLAAFGFDRAKAAPKQILQDAAYQDLSAHQPKDAFYRNVIANLNQSQPIDPSHQLNLLTRAIHSTNTGDNDAAIRAYDNILQKHPRHAIALLGKACILLRKRQYAPALRLYQQILEISLAIQNKADKDPEQQQGWKGPDARVGIGLCLWGLGLHDPARKAWKRATAVNPKNAAAHLLLALSSINASKQPSALLPGTFGAVVERSEQEAREMAYAEGMASLQESWKLEKRNAMAAVAMCEFFINKASEAAKQGGDEEVQTTVMNSYASALKLGEHAIQYADSRSAVVQAWLCYARASHLASQLPANTAKPELRLQAQRYYTRVIDDLSRQSASSTTSQQLAPGLTLAVLGLAQCQLANRDHLAAINTLDSLTSRPASSVSASQILELSLLAASLRAHSHPGATPSERSADAERARVMLDRVLRIIKAAKHELPGGSGGDAQHESEEMPEANGANGKAANGSSDVGGLVAKALSVLRAEELSQTTLDSIAALGNDPLVHVEFASLLQTEDLTRATAAYAEALRLASKAEDASAAVPLLASLQTNLGAILALRAFEVPTSDAHRKDERAWLLGRGIARLESAIAGASTAGANAASQPETQRIFEAVRVMASYNLGRSNEVAGNPEQAKQAFEALLRAHPEYVDAKVRLALLTVGTAPAPGPEAAAAIRQQRDAANTLFKEALAADPGNLDTRASYVCFLAGELPGNPTSAWAAIKDFTAQLFAGPEAGKSVFGSAAAAKAAADEGRRDPHTLASLGWAYYQLAIHAQPGPDVRAERAKGMTRAADLMDKALTADARCAFAAQCMAILYAEDAFSEISNGNTSHPLLGGGAPSEERRKKNADEAIAILSKLREVREDGSVHVCMGHALMVKDEFERALKAYELASRRYYHQSSSVVLQYMARAEYALGMKVKSFSHLRNAFQHLESAKAIVTAEKGRNHPEWKQMAYNQAVMAHKSLQLLFDLPREKKTSAEIRAAIEAVEKVQPLLTAAEGSAGELIQAAQKGQLSYISAEIVEQRGKYGEGSLLRQAPTAVAEQEAYEDELRRQKESVIQARKEKELALEQERIRKEEQYRQEAELMAEKRRLAREEARKIEYTREATPEKEPRRRKAGGGGGDDDDEGRGGKRKRGGGGRKKKGRKHSDDEDDEDSSEEDDALFGGGAGSSDGSSEGEESEDGDAEIIRNGLAAGIDGDGDEGGRRRRDKKERKMKKLAAKVERRKKESNGGAGKKRRKLVKRVQEDSDDAGTGGGGGGGGESDDEGPRRKKGGGGSARKIKKVARIENDMIDSDEEMMMLGGVPGEDEGADGDGDGDGEAAATAEGGEDE